MNQIEDYSEYLDTIEKLTTTRPRLNELFHTIPNMSTDHYQLTAYIYAKNKFEEEMLSNGPIPHGFFQIVDEKIKEKGLLITLKEYSSELTIISETLGIELHELKQLLKELRPKNNKTSEEKEAELKARQLLKQYFRKFNAVYKENFITRIVEEKMANLQRTTYEVNNQPKKTIPPDEFVNSIIYNPLVLKRVHNIILENFGFFPSKQIIIEILLETTKKNYINNICRILNIKEPIAYKSYLNERHIRRLEQNFLPKLNKMCASFTEEEKQGILKVIEYEVKCIELNKPRNDKTFNELKMFIYRVHMDLIHSIANLMHKSGTKITLENNEFKFIFPPRITPIEKIECEKHRDLLSKVKKVHNTLYTLYEKQNAAVQEFIEESKTSIPEEESVIIDKTQWLDKDKITALINEIDNNAIKRLPDKAFTVLKRFLIKDGLLWTYLADNIKLETIKKIINNFDAIYTSTKNSEITLKNLPIIIKKANLYDYVDDFTVALIGLDNLSKIINYNQFLGVPVTEEIIKERLNKVVDLALRSEETNTSSLPFSCDIKTPKYSIQRYLNNDPEIFVSGIDTKTCFCVGVNENDFFFYSLLNKDGYVLKIVDQQNRLIARASCFRKNNVLMINGIRFINNKTIPENREELITFKEIIELVKLWAKKMILITKDDECPIDYIVCNKAGILENSIFEDRFERINADLFREPINVYNDEWQDFVHMYDKEPTQLLQEVPYQPDHSFTTDFGNHYPALLIESRDNMGLVSPRNISLKDQPATYTRPRKAIVELITEEIDYNFITIINRIRALDYHRRKKEGQKLLPFSLIKNARYISKVCIGDDWLIIIDKNNQSHTYFAKQNRKIYEEAYQYLLTIRTKDDKDIKLFKSYKKKD